MKRSQVWAMAVLGVVAVGCKGKADKGEGSGKTAKAAPVDPAAASALVPKELAGKLAFEAVTVDGKIAAAVPKGWQSGAIPGRYKPSDESLGFMTSYEVGTNCDGTCEAKDWAAVADKVEFAQFATGFTVERDDKGDGHRLLVAHNDSSTFLVEAWWHKGDNRYLSCRATLDGDIAKAVAAFQKACSMTHLE